MERNRWAILVFALRYSLGRKTYASSVVVEEILENWKDMPEDVKSLIAGEIKSAIGSNRAGMQCDIQELTKVLHKYEEDKRCREILT